ncbi:MULTISPECIES: GNAT family N-acetyltransferase [unclassified Breznakia]|uniref:GNAT family N-acetyltransferase n=1 Tax=unclassified Breznakia TaxID=2623764 RepID=UPI0024749278|nr:MULTISPECIES: GNAT family N-acetyltransferase [unclassified Breznakia]MDH6366308.1 putative N-acetyltransferase YhbS [Breznakia sp. PH1-1]MDH6403401.1 putative N-acetyltransferase YhbS [Breznakia sp. PF1-11]MDH6411110.1 putative N-acetyltransferase YhbS [Breznakia sp. PFB1-11]MDH6413627.1 putative N-acetyltransferase YhbS [Breznakia sp. PFB1-14]MDH6415655.1 putative N-acetyltransferase YhbS [Breznakia sp. PFB1-4]
MKSNIQIKEERITAIEYIDFLKRTNLGSQYPKERFEKRIETLVNQADISLVARNEKQLVVGVLFGLTDYAYWLFITDLGVDRRYEKQGIGKRLMQQAHELAGSKDDISIYLVANQDAIPFYEKFGMKKSEDVMEFSQVQWTSFTVD